MCCFLVSVKPDTAIHTPWPSLLTDQSWTSIQSVAPLRPTLLSVKNLWKQWWTTLRWVWKYHCCYLFSFKGRNGFKMKCVLDERPLKTVQENNIFCNGSRFLPQWDHWCLKRFLVLNAHHTAKSLIPNSYRCMNASADLILTRILTKKHWAKWVKKFSHEC